MSEESNKYCTLIDKFGEIADNNKDYKKVFMLLSKLCMLSLLTKRVTFLMPVDKALTKLEKMKPDQQREQIKRHIIGGAFTKDELLDRETVYTRLTTQEGGEYKRIAYKVDKAKGSIGGVKIGKEIVVVKGETKESKHIPIGVALEVDDLLSEPGEGVPMRTKEKGEKKGRKKMEGGMSPFELLMERDVNYLLELEDNELRWAIVEAYRKSWPLTVFGIDSEYSWYQWMWASLLSFMKEQMSDFYWVYSPYLGMDPYSSLDLLFEYHVRDNYYNYILPNDLIHQWVQSKWFLYNDPSILREAAIYLAGGGAQYGGGGPFDPFISLNFGMANRYVAVGKEAIGEYMRTASPEKIRDGIVKVYKKVYEEPNFILGETRTIYQKVDEEPFVVGLHNDLRRFMSSRFRYHSEFDSLYPSFLKCSDCDSNKSGFLRFFGFGGEKTSKSLARVLIKNLLQYDIATMSIDLGGSDKYRFPYEFLEDFVLSPYFLYMSILDKPDLKQLATDRLKKEADIRQHVEKTVVQPLIKANVPVWNYTMEPAYPQKPNAFGLVANGSTFPGAMNINDDHDSDMEDNSDTSKGYMTPALAGLAAQFYGN